jgi:hypothetical protein
LNLPAREPAAARRAGPRLSLSRERSSAERADPPCPGECQDHVLFDRIQGLLDSWVIVLASEGSIEGMRGDLHVVHIDDFPGVPKHGWHEVTQPVMLPSIAVVEPTS